MILSHSHRFIFIKSVKTAGTSIEAALSNHCNGDDVVTPLGNYKVNRDEKGEWVHQSMNPGNYQQHDTALDIKKKTDSDIWNSYFKFSVARNPWDRVVSLYFWRCRNNAEFKPRKRLYHHLGVPYDDFSETKKLFARYVSEGEWKTNDIFYVIDGQLCVDYVIRYEHLGDDLAQVCKTIGIPTLELPHLKGGIRQQNHSYVDYYDTQSREIVAERHKNDIRYFGYKFGEG